MSTIPLMLHVLAILVLLALSAGVNAASAATVGLVTRVQGPAEVLSRGGVETAVVGTLVHMNDQVRTGPEARIEVTFRDKTVLTLGEKASVTIDRYVYSPETSTG
ncbi:MAG: hypothetical protein R3245_08590, partial [Kiloniellales bacterium]|nr:hypothetical protein [Kiloniellales bacterium]